MVLPHARAAPVARSGAGTDGVLVADMPADAQRTRVYEEYLAALADSPADAMEYYAVSVVGPENRVAKLVKGMALLE